MKTPKEWTALLKQEALARLEAGETIEAVLGDDASEAVIARIQMDALEAAAQHCEKSAIEHPSYNEDDCISCLGDEIRKLKS